MTSNIMAARLDQTTTLDPPLPAYMTAADPPRARPLAPNVSEDPVAAVVRDAGQHFRRADERSPAIASSLDGSPRTGAETVP